MHFLGGGGVGGHCVCALLDGCANMRSTEDRRGVGVALSMLLNYPKTPLVVASNLGCAAALTVSNSLCSMGEGYGMGRGWWGFHDATAIADLG